MAWAAGELRQSRGEHVQRVGVLQDQIGPDPLSTPSAPLPLVPGPCPPPPAGLVSMLQTWTCAVSYYTQHIHIAPLHLPLLAPSLLLLGNLFQIQIHDCKKCEYTAWIQTNSASVHSWQPNSSTSSPCN